MNITIMRFLCINKGMVNGKETQNFIARNYGEAVKLVNEGCVKINGKTLVYTLKPFGFEFDHTHFVCPNDKIEVVKNDKTITIIGQSYVFKGGDEEPLRPYNGF